jgi:hypothetical protein
VVTPHGQRQGVKTLVLVYDRATVHTSKETQSDIGRAFEKDSREAQAPKSLDTNNGGAGLFLSGTRATACSGVTTKAGVEKTVAAW